MNDILKDCTKTVLEKMNLFVVLQIIWMIEFHILSIFSIKDFFNSVIKEEIKEPPIIKEYNQVIADWLDTYNEYVLFMGIIFIIVGILGSCLKQITVLNRYKIVYTYLDFGLYAGGWFVLIFGTYRTYAHMGKLFGLAPIIAVVLCFFIKNIIKWLELQGITFGG